jgi:hypothetical protein
MTDQPPANPSNDLPATRPDSQSIRSRGVESVIVTPDVVIDETRLRSLTDPFARITPTRLPAREIVTPDGVVDSELIRAYVTPQRQGSLLQQIEAIQEEVVRTASADRTLSDALLEDLRYAASLLFVAPSNYEEASQIVYRVRADLQRERRVMDDVRRYRPWLILYHLVWLLLMVFAVTLNDEFRALVPEEVKILRLALLPMIFGVLGAVFNGLMALHEHTTIRRDFDPTHVTWYLTNPLTGGVMGLVVFVFFVVTGSSFTPDLARTVEMDYAPLTIWLLAFVVGWQQNILFQLLNRFLKTVVPSARESAARPPAERGTPEG